MMERSKYPTFVYNGYLTRDSKYFTISFVFLFFFQQCNVAANEVCCTVRVPPPPPPPPTRASNEYIPPPRPTPPPATPCLDRNSVCVQAYQCNNGVVQRGNPLASNQPVSARITSYCNPNATLAVEMNGTCIVQDHKSRIAGDGSQWICLSMIRTWSSCPSDFRHSPGSNHSGLQTFVFSIDIWET